MATVIDALYVTLGLQAKGFKEGVAGVRKDLASTREDARKTASDMEASGKVAAEFFSRLRREALGLLAIFTAGVGIKSFTENTILGAASLGRMSANLNMSARDLATWQLAAKNAGGTAEGITAQLKESSDAAARAKYGQFGSSEEWFFRMGGDPQALKDGNTYLQARAKIVADLYKVDPSRARYVAQQMGIGEDAFNLIKQGPAAIAQLRQAQAGLAEELSRASGPAERLRQRFDTLQNRFTSIGVRIITELMPAFDRLLDWLSRLSDWISAHRQDIVQWVDKSVDAIKSLVQWADKAAQSVGGWQNVLIGLGAVKLATMVSPLLSIAGALTSIASSLGLIGGASGAAGVAALGTLGAVAGGAALAVYSQNLDKGEDEQLRELNSAPANRDQQLDAVRFFMSRGYSREQAVGLVANLQRESSFNPHSVNGSHYGLGQWDPRRQADFRKAFGIDIRKATLQQQLEFVDWELKNTEATAREKLLAAKTPQQAAEAVSKFYERTDNGAEEARRRAAMAGALYGSSVMESVRNGSVRMVDASGKSPAPISNTSSTTTTETNINGPITINTQATDAHGIARDLFSAAKEYSLAAQANTGLR